MVTMVLCLVYVFFETDDSKVALKTCSEVIVRGRGGLIGEAWEPRMLEGFPCRNYHLVPTGDEGSRNEAPGEV